MSENVVQENMDIGLSVVPETAETDTMPSVDFNDFSDKSDTTPSEEVQGVDLTVTHFPQITKHLEEKPHNFFDDPNYYKNTLLDEGDIAQRVHGILQKYTTAKDPKDRGVFRQQFIAPYWEFLKNVARKTTGQISPAKKFLLRFGIMHPAFITPETKDFFGRVVVENELEQPIYYMDEWLKAVGSGVIHPSTTDEVKTVSNNNQAKLNQLLEKATGKLEGAKVMLKAKNKERTDMENMLRGRFDVIFEHTPFHAISDASNCYTETQKSMFSEIQNLLRDLLKNDHDLGLSINDYTSAEEDVHTLTAKIETGDGIVSADVGAIDAEFDTIRQMAKMTIGRQGNHFPILTKDYFHCGPNEVGTRENVIAMLAKIESIDAEVYCRVYKNKLNRIPPFVFLIPSYGDTGFCWEPFERHNRATSRGRIVIPMYPKNLYIAVLSAVANLRWQVAKEKASFDWMEEGLTGNYYQWFQAKKMKGDIKELFIQDYILWMTKEAEGIQKLDKEVRGTFWRYMPFTTEVKEKLKTRSFVYQELCQHDQNRAMSDGY
jgi:hypothetical protein